MNWVIPKIWRGVCWILGGGVSVAEQFGVPETLIPDTREEFYQFGEYLSPILHQNVIGVNVGAFVSDKIKLAFWGDNDTYLDFKTWFDAFGGIKVTSSGKFSDPSYKSIYYVYKNPREAITKSPSEVGWGARNSAAAAISLAHHLGATTIILLGIDLKRTNGRNRWHAGYPDKRRTPNNKALAKGLRCPKIEKEEPFARHAVGYPAIAKEAEKLGLRIINASPDSVLDCFPKMTVEAILRGMEKGDIC